MLPFVAKDSDYDIRLKRVRRQPHKAAGWPFWVFFRLTLCPNKTLMSSEQITSVSPKGQTRTNDPASLAAWDSSQAGSGPAKPWPTWIRVLVSSLLAVHFGLIALTYFSNNSTLRMPIADRMLQLSHPYLIGFGWYTELLPMSLVGSESYDKPIQIEYRTDKNSRTWTNWIETTTSNARWRRLCQLAGALAVNENEDGLGEIALSLVEHARTNGLEIEQIRLTTQADDAQGKSLLYQATIIPLESGETTLVPQLESTRTVPVTLPKKP